MLNGIDVSSYQKFTSYDSLNDTNLAFAYIKASERLSRNPNYAGHYENLAKTKLLTGAYHFFRFDPNAGGVAQANAFLSAIGNKLNSFDLPPALDIEDDSEKMRFFIRQRSEPDINSNILRWISFSHSRPLPK